MKKIKKENKNLLSRLENYKFKDALQYLSGEDDEIKDLVQALADTFGNVGWFFGTLETIVNAAVNSIKPEEAEDDN